MFYIQYNSVWNRIFIKKLEIFFLLAFVLAPPVLTEEQTATKEYFFQIRIADPGNSEKSFYYTGFRSENSEAGIITYKRISPYANIIISSQPFFFRAGYLNKTPYNGFLLSNGGYFPYYEALPYKQPFGFTARFQPIQAGKYFDITTQRYYRNRSINTANSKMDVSERNFRDELTAVRLNLRYPAKRFTATISGSLFSVFQKTDDKSITHNGSLLFSSLAFRFNTDIYFRVELSYSPLLGEIFHVEVTKEKFKIVFFTSRLRYENPFASQLYEKNISQFILAGKGFSWKGGYSEGDLFSKGSYENKGFGAIFYSSESSENYIGIYHYFEEQFILPVLYYYRNPGTSDYMYSVGMGFAKKARISFVQMHSSKDRSYPLDPAYFPVSLYNDNLREDMAYYFSGKKRGIELFLTSKNIQVVGVYLQPFRPKRRSDIYYDIRVNYVWHN